MQKDSTIANPADARNRLAPQALPPLQRRIVLGMWLGLLLFYYVAFSPLPDDESDWGGGYWSLAHAGTWLTLVCLSAISAALAQQPLTVRLPRALGLAAVLMLMNIWNDRRSQLQPLLCWALEAPVFFLMSFIPLSLFRWLIGWRIGLPERVEQPAGRPSTQFSLRQLVSWMGATAVLLAWSKCLVPDAKSFHEGFQVVPLPDLLIYLLQTAVSCPPIILTGIGLILGERSRIKFAFLTLAALTSVVTVDLCGNGPFPVMNWGMAAVTCAQQSVGFGIWLLGTLLVLRLCGYRLLRLKEERLVSASPAATDTTIPACKHPTPAAMRPGTWQTPFPHLVTIILLIGLTLCWPAWKLEPARHRMALRRAWEAVGVSPTFNAGEVKSLDFDISSETSLAGLQKLQELRSAPAFERLTLPALTDDQMHYLRGLATLRDLDLEESPLTDAGLAQLDGLDSLQTLRLQNTQITDKGLAHLKRFPNLTCLELDGTRIADAGLAHLAGLRMLQSLDLTHTSITDAGLKHIQQLKSLEELWLHSAQITDAGLVHLTSLQRLRELNLENTRITDAGLKHLQSLENLESLRLDDTQITDAGLAQLQSLKKLHILGIFSTQVTNRGFAEFKRALPACRVSWE